MKPNIHPEVHQDAKVNCTACNAVFTIPSTVKEQQTEVCSNCHPVYTGKYRGITSSGRVERFQKKMATAASVKKTIKPKKRKLTEEEKMELKAKEAAEKIKEKKAAEEEKKKEKAVKEAKKTVVKKTTTKKKKAVTKKKKATTKKKKKKK
ncbi:50S ribosomal protein L31 [Candidatus Peribacteria bacterium]|jgi:large subunit ribosomal protein L31|nr:50S ribosomal protein L31 [Candidatus Peribacteria bacterium]MBT4021671.1 50S ribosomal protein L31 [Candidatus Peribacteria bacterium]MBT4240833.1 50S ribosomal protein L31 [Candidatus Peribacteria bacterium]MBT4473785.1 50S ribosomal protein L31 [Candidatus Peribacteria bacterium]